MRPKLKEIHPGEILYEEFLEAMRIKDVQLASDIDMDLAQIQELIAGKQPITVDIAMRLGLYFGMDARFWLNLQTEYDIRSAEANLLPEIKKKIRPHATHPA
jgi:addiction module HigA family antidote